MRSIVIYYSRSGNTKFVAQEVAVALRSDLKELVDLKSRKGLWGYMKAGFDSLMQNKTRLGEFEINLIDYDLIFIGCPNWAGNMPPALRTFLQTVYLANKKVVFFCTQDSMGAGGVFNNLRRLAKGAEVIDEKYFNKVNSNKEAIRGQIKEWLKKFKV